MCVSISLGTPPEGCWVGSKVARCTRVQSNGPPRLWGVHEGTWVLCLLSPNKKKTPPCKKGGTGRCQWSSPVPSGVCMELYNSSTKNRQNIQG